MFCLKRDKVGDLPSYENRSPTLSGNFSQTLSSCRFIFLKGLFKSPGMSIVELACRESLREVEDQKLPHDVSSE